MRYKCLITSLVIAGLSLSSPANAQVFGKKDEKPDARTRSQESVAQADALVKQQKFTEAV